jgi:replicative DNA helicase
LKKGKLQPQAIELEEAVLGAMMIDKRVDVIDICNQMLYKESHKHIFEAIVQLLRYATYRFINSVCTIKN